MAVAAPFCRQLSVVALLILSANAASTDYADYSGTYTSPADYICSNQELSTLCRIIKAAGNGQGAQYMQSGTTLETVFAPTDDAFTEDASSAGKSVGLSDFNDIYTNPTAADKLLRGLIVPNQALLSAAFKSGTNYKSLLGQDLEYTTAWFTSQVYIKSKTQAEIIQKDIRAGQAVIHIVNRVPYF